MEWWIVVIIVAVLAGCGYFLATRKAAPPKLEEEARPKALESGPAKLPESKPKQVESKQPASLPAVQQEEPREKRASVRPVPIAESSGQRPARPDSESRDVPRTESGALPEHAQETKPAVEQAKPSETPLPGGRAGTPPAPTKPPRDVKAIRRGLGKTRGQEGFFGRLAKLITGRTEIDPSLADEIQDVLIASDVGVQTAQIMLERIRNGLTRKELADSSAIWGALREEARRILQVGPGGLALRTTPTVILMVGVNGSGKTTTIGKLATQLKADGRKVVLAAGDTFRAAAVQQLEVWGKRVGCEVVKGKDGADPAAVIFEAIQKATSSGADVVLADTAGRLHTKTPLMDELKKVARTMGKAMEGAPHEVLLVIDATNGQNALAQSRQFAEAMPLTGIVLTKLDGTAKGGMVLGICDELKMPVRYIGLGERADDLRSFDADEFVEALLGEAEADEEAA